MCIIRLVLNNGEDVFEILATGIYGITVINAYKVPIVEWRNSPFKIFEHLAIYVGDFNSYSLMWRYNLMIAIGTLL